MCKSLVVSAFIEFDSVSNVISLGASRTYPSTDHTRADPGQHPGIMLSQYGDNPASMSPTARTDVTGAADVFGTTAPALGATDALGDTEALVVSGVLEANEALGAGQELRTHVLGASESLSPIAIVRAMQQGATVILEPEAAIELRQAKALGDSEMAADSHVIMYIISEV